MKDDLILTGRRPDSPHSPSREICLKIMRLRDWEKPVPFEEDAAKLMHWLATHLPPGTMAALEWDRDAVREVARLRTENERLTKLLEQKESTHV